jgi:2-methylcitrate dehydratase PrpD
MHDADAASPRMSSAPPAASVSERLAEWIVALDPARLPQGLRVTCEHLLLDVAGLCLAARGTDYVAAAVAGWNEDGACTALGHRRSMSTAGAAFVNGTAAHGEDFDDTFEGGPVHAGAVVVPAVLAACESEHRHGGNALIGVAVGTELMCRLSLVAPKALHEAGFHPTAVLGAPAAAAAVGAALGLSPRALVDAFGIAGSMASGIIEYLAEGAWTKRMHAGWAAQSGLRAALLARSGFVGPRTVLEGEHGLLRGFARTGGNLGALSGDLGRRWLAQTLAFKPYPCGTMTHPYIDCARRLAARGIAAQDIVALECEVAEGTVHRLWEPLALKQRPPNGYAGKFSTPYCIAAAFLRGELVLDDFSDAAVQDPATVSLASRVRYRVDPANPYPRAFTGHARAVLADGRVIEERQPHLRGGVREPLTQGDIEAKLRRNARHGGVDDARTSDILARLRSLYDAEAIDLSFLRF